MSKQPIGKNQSYARTLNNKAVMNLLRSGDMTQTMLAKQTGLSNVAISLITSALLRYGLIKRSDTQINSPRGRHPQMLSLNENYGCIVVVTFSDDRIGYVVSNMKGEVICSHMTPFTDTIEEKTLYKIILAIKQTLETETKGLPLRGIDISAPGKINNASGEMTLSPHFAPEITAKPNYLPELFGSYFSAPVKITNDIKLAAIGETDAGWCEGRAANAMLVHVDRGLGSALILGGKLYLGTRGYAGEIGLMQRTFDGRRQYLDDIVSFNGMCAALNAKGCAATVETLAERYKSGDEQVVEHINQTAMVLGDTLKDIVELLDLSDIRFGGMVTEFGQQYLDVVAKRIECSTNTVRIDYSGLGSDASIRGAISKAVTNIMISLLEDNEFKIETSLL